MLKIGFIDLDTSHPRSFVKRLNAMENVQVTGVFDRGRKKGKEETKKFCEEFGVTEFDSVNSLCENCDGVMVLSADWGTHFKDVECCMRHGKACYCDKPVFASRDEIDAFLGLAQETQTPFLGGSGWRWNQTSRKFFEETSGKKIQDILITGQSELFYYGIHTVDWLLGLIGSGAEWVKYEAKAPNMSFVSLGHQRGCTVRMLLEMAFDTGRFFWTNVEGQEYSVSLDVDTVHNGICNNFIEMLKTGRQPAQYNDYMESLLIMFALEESRVTGKRVKIKDASRIKEIDSTDFMTEYCKLP